MALFHRAFIRAGIKLKYSEGFNPHPYLSVALPLPVGCASLCELMDAGIVDDIVPDIIDMKLPEGIIVNNAYYPVRKFNNITWVEINCNLHYEKHINNDIIEKLKHSFSKDSIKIQKRTKRSIKELDIAPFVRDMEFYADKSKSIVTMKAKISAQEPTLNVDDLLKVFDNDLLPVQTDMKRIEIYDSNMVSFN